ncbi:hypothetical protein AA0614_2939 [Komagataeibacter saccharivorans NRIC 0614]|nr:hypothetical protein AA0614_2939 [Komagataeibacter saccharivorans NRIC 0614]
MLALRKELCQFLPECLQIMNPALYIRDVRLNNLVHLFTGPGCLPGQIQQFPHLVQ